MCCGFVGLATWDDRPVPQVDIERLISRVVGEVFGDTVEVSYTPHPKYADDWRALVVSKIDPTKTIEIRATHEWFTAHIPALNVGTIVFEYDEDEAEKAAALRELSLVARAYLRGDGKVEFKRSRFGRRTRASVTIHLDDKHWVLGKGTSSISSS